MAKEVVVRPHILSNRARRVENIDFGMTIQEVVDSIPNLDDRVRQRNLAVLIDGVTVPREFWSQRRVRKQDAKIEVMAVLSGGGGNNKQILALVATVFLFAFAGWAAAGLTAQGGMLAGMSYTMVKAGIVLVGTLAINAIFKPPRVNNGGNDASPTYSFSGQTNQARQFGRLVRIYGRHRYIADIAAVPYTVNAGDDQYLYVVYSFGYGPNDLEDFKIGTNPIGNYTDVDMVVHENFTDASQLQLYRKDVWQDPYNLELAKDVPVTVTTQIDTDRAMVDIAWPSGLGEIDSEDGDHVPRISSTLLEYRTAGSSDAWEYAQIRSVSRGRTVGMAHGSLIATEQVVTQGYSNDIIDYYIPAGINVFTVGSWGPDGPPLPGTKVEYGRITGFTLNNFNPVVLTVASADATTLTTVETLQFAIRGGAGQKVDITYQSPTEVGQGKWDIEGYYGAGFSASADIVFPSKGQWEVRITKLDTDEGDSTTKMWKKFVTSLKSLKNLPPIDPAVPMSIVELKIRATGQLSGNIERFSAVVTSKLQTWNGSAWVVAPTRNTAWIYLDILRGTANPKPIPDSRIDLDRMKEWAVRNDNVDAGFNEPLGTCDIVIDRSYTLWELLQSVAATGRAAPGMRDNMYSVIIDDAARTPVQMFTPRNSSNLQSTRTYVREPHALRVKWIDPKNDWAPAEIIVYNTGYTAETATEFEELQSFGMTRPEQVTRWGRYMLAQGKLRQERFTLETDLENIVCTRGDLVLVAHDVLEVGGEACRVVEVAGLNVYLDAPPTIDTTQLPANIGIRIRKSNGTFTPVIHISAYGNDGEFDFVTVTEADVSFLTSVGQGNLLVFGPVNSVVGEYVVDYIRPKGELGATIGLEELAPGVYTAESSGVIPPYTPPGGGRQPAPGVSNLSYQLMEYYSGIRPMARIKLKWRPNSAVSYLPESYRIVEVMEDGTETMLAEQAALEYETAAMNMLNWAGRTRNFRVRAYYGARGLSGWSQIGLTLPVRTALPPAEVDSFTVESLSAERRRYRWSWTAGQPADVDGVQIRYVAGTVAIEALDWLTMTELVSGAQVIVQSGIELNKPLGAGTFTFLCRSVDRLGNLSPTGFRTVANLSIVAPANDTTPPPTPSGFAASGGFGEVTFTCDNPTYTVGRGHGYTQVYGAIVDGVEPTFADAQPFTSFTGERGVAGAPPATTYRFWAKWVSKDGGISVTPAGPVTGVTAIDVAATLDALTGQLTEDQLYVDLGARINLIDGPSSLVGSVNARVEGEANLRSSADNLLGAKLDGEFSLSNFWSFDTTTEGWAGGGGGSVNASNPGFLTMVGTAANPVVSSPIININGADYDTIRARVTWVSGGAFDGNAYYTTSGHGNVVGFRKQIALPEGFGPGKTAVLEWDMSNLTAGGTDWKTSTIISIRLDILDGTSVPCEVRFDWISIGKRQSASLAAFLEEQQTRATADTAEAVARTALTARVFNQAAGAVFSENWEDPNVLANWTNAIGSGELSIIAMDSQLAGSGKGLQVGNNAGDDMAWMVHNNLIPFNPDKLYRMEIRVSRSLGTGAFYAGVAGVKADGVTTVNPAGVTGSAQGHYFTAANEVPGSAFTTYVGYLQGYGVGSGSANDNWDPHLPAKMHPDVRYIKPLFITNYNSLAGRMLVGQITITDGAADRNSQDIASTSASLTTEQTTRANADSAMASDITTLQTKVVTSPNLLPNGGFEMGGTDWTLSANAASPLYELSGWGPCYYKSNPPDGTGIVTSDFFPAQASGVYTITGDTRLTFAAGGSATACYFDMLFYDSSGTLLLDSGQSNKTTSHFFSTDNTNRDAHVLTATAPAGTTKMKARFVWSGTGIATVGCRQIKVERGSVATPYSQEVTMQVQATVTDGLSGQYTVKIDANGYVSGFGLASTPIDGTPVSTFAVRSDKFYIASPSGPGVTPAMPFIVYTTTQTINGASVPPGVYMRSAFIHNAFITSAMIQNLDASKVNATSLSAITATIGTLRTASSGARMEIRDNVIKVYDSSGILRVRLGNLSL